MTRGKNAAAATERARAAAAAAADELRQETIRANRAERMVADRDAEIRQLRAALEASRTERLVVGTYSEADFARVRSEMRLEHRRSVVKGLRYLEGAGVPILPSGGVAETAEAFDIDPASLFDGVPNAPRTARRATARTLHVLDELDRQGR